MPNTNVPTNLQVVNNDKVTSTVKWDLPIDHGYVTEVHLSTQPSSGFTLLETTKELKTLLLINRTDDFYIKVWSKRINGSSLSAFTSTLLVDMTDSSSVTSQDVVALGGTKHSSKSQAAITFNSDGTAKEIHLESNIPHFRKIDSIVYNVVDNGTVPGNPLYTLNTKLIGEASYSAISTAALSYTSGVDVTLTFDPPIQVKSNSDLQLTVTADNGTGASATFEMKTMSIVEYSNSQF